MKRSVEVVGAVIIKDGKVLVFQRPENKGSPLLWEFPGGKIEPGETGEEALKRELSEELEVDAIVKEQICDIVHEYPDIIVHLTLYLTDIVNGSIKLIEHNDMKAVTVDEMKNIDFSPADKVLLPEIVRFLKNIE